MSTTICLDAAKLKKLPVHFILCTERTGSSMLTGMLNQKPDVLCASEELFALYFYRKYGKKTHWSEKDIRRFVDEFVLMSEDHIGLYFSDPLHLEKNLLQIKDQLDYPLLLRAVYLHFLDLKDKSSVQIIIDKQIKFLFHLKEVQQVFPDSKVLVLTRDVRDNILSRHNRKMNGSENLLYLAALWNETYANVPELLERFPGKVMILKYEDLVAQPETALQKVCTFFGTTYDETMLGFNQRFSDFVEAKKAKVGEEMIGQIRDFHSSMLEPVSAGKIGKWKEDIPAEDARKVAALCYETGKILGYDFAKPYGLAQLDTEDIAQARLAEKRRTRLLRFYLRLPLWLKLVIKRRKRMFPSEV